MVIEAIPGAQFVLEIVALATVAATAATYRLNERGHDFNVGRVVAEASFFAMLIGTLIQGVALAI
jgi:hypothetical protein